MAGVEIGVDVDPAAIFESVQQLQFRQCCAVSPQGTAAFIVIDNAQDAEAPTIGERITDKVQVPTLA